MTETMIETKFGKAYLNKDEYYQIKSGNKKYKGKLLHRVIFEDFYKIKLDEEFPKGVHIHHIDGNRTNNEIWNLEPINPSEHQKLHQTGENNNMYGKKNRNMLGIPCSIERMRSISKSKTITGFFRVYKKKNKIYSQGFQWCYHYYKDGEKRQTHITSVDLLKLKKKVIEKGLEWFIIDEETAKSICVEHNYDLSEVS